MKNSNTADQKESGFVEVVNEPLHVELFRNKNLRLYNASLEPGTGTMFHRHSEDTIYIAHRGGVISTETFPGSPKSSTAFPRSFSIRKKLAMAIRLLLTGSVKLPDNLFFCILSKKNPVIHRAVASDDNARSMELMGIEITEESGAGGAINLKGDCYDREYENEKFAVIRLRIKPGSSKNLVFSFPGLVVALKGSIELEKMNSSSSRYDELQAGEYIWHDFNTTRQMVNSSGELFEALIIAVK